jgi:hypothetical protein
MASPTPDLANRASIIRIRKRASGFIFHAYPEGDLFAHVVANQPYLLGCVVSIITKWSDEGCSRTTETRHAFREWSQILDWIVQNIFAAAPLLDGHESARERFSDPRRNWLRAISIALRDANQTGAFLASQLAEFATDHDLTPPGIRPEVDSRDMARRIGTIMGAVFGQNNEIEIDGFKIYRERQHSNSDGKDSKVYHFGRFQPELPLELPPARQPANAANADTY